MSIQRTEAEIRCLRIAIEHDRQSIRKDAWIILALLRSLVTPEKRFRNE